MAPRKSLVLSVTKLPSRECSATSQPSVPTTYHGCSSAIPSEPRVPQEFQYPRDLTVGKEPQSPLLSTGALLLITSQRPELPSALGHVLSIPPVSTTDESDSDQEDVTIQGPSSIPLSQPMIVIWVHLGTHHPFHFPPVGILGFLGNVQI